jgi:cell division transport system permease protein
MAKVDSVEEPGAFAEQVEQFGDVARLCASDISYEVFLNVDATPTQVADVRAALDADSGVRSHRFVDRATASAEFRRQFRDDEDVLGSISAADLPESFRVEVRDPATSDALEQRLAALPGVDTVESPAALCDELRSEGLIPSLVIQPVV